MGIKPFWTSTVSVLFRISACVYLRLVPFHHILGPIIVVTLVLYYLALVFQDAPHAATTEIVEVFKEEIVDVKEAEDSNGIPVNLVESISAQTVVATPGDEQPSVRITITHSYTSADFRLALRPTCYPRALAPVTLQGSLPRVSRYQHPPRRILHPLYVYTRPQDL